MDRAHTPGLPVVEEDHDAVGGEHKEGQARHIGNQGVGLIVRRTQKALAGVGGGDGADLVTVDLLGQDRPLL